MLAVIETPEGFATFLAERLEKDRQYAEARMTETWLFDRPTGATTVDENDSDVPEYEDVHETRGRLSGVDAAPRESEAGSRSTVATHPELHTPIEETPEIKPGDRVRCTALGPGSDPNLLSETFYVVATPVGSQKTARRWPVERWEA